jgi:hypothetical protein
MRNLPLTLTLRTQEPDSSKYGQAQSGKVVQVRGNLTAVEFFALLAPE